MASVVKWLTTKKSILFLMLLGMVPVITGMTVLLLIAYKKILPPNTSIAGVDVSMQTPQSALEKVERALPPPPEAELWLSSEYATSSANLGELGLYPNTLAVVAEAQQPQLNQFERAWFALQSLFQPQQYNIRYSFTPNKIEQWVAEYAQAVDAPGLKPRAVLGRPGVTSSIDIEPGEAGILLDQAATTTMIENNFNHGRLTTHALFFPIQEPLSEAQVAQATERVSEFVGKKLELTNDYLLSPHVVTDQDLVSVLALPSGIDQQELVALVATIAAQIDRKATEPEFAYDPNTFVVTQFAPPRVGLRLNQAQTLEQIRQAIEQIDNKNFDTDNDQATEVQEIAAIVMETQPTTALSDTNDLGIAEQIGFGDSHYDHSIPTRIRNVSLATSRVSNVLVAPGKEFSFNKTLGEVSRATGFEPAYIIRNGMTELGDGGGVCQVSTTLFRAVLNAGLKVTLRLPHSYRVSYYELDQKPGIDATVYAGNIDLRFVNDTPNYILIHGEADPDNLYMYYSIYGTDDGRSTEIKDHVTWGYQSAPPPQYIVDETLPPGSKRQIDWAAPGIKAKFTNVIYDKFGEVVREDTYTSSYRPWAAKYLVGPGTI